MTWPFENDTSAITKKLAKKSLQSEKRRNLMVVIAVALAAFLICFTGIVSTSLTQMQRNQVVDTYEAVWLGVEENDIETLKGLPEFERVGAATICWVRSFQNRAIMRPMCIATRK